MPIIIDDTKHDDPAFMKAQIVALKQNLMGCHNELEMVYGELSQALRENKNLKKELETAYGELHAQKKKNEQLWLLYDKAQKILWKNNLDIEEDEKSI